MKSGMLCEASHFEAWKSLWNVQAWDFCFQSVFDKVLRLSRMQCDSEGVPSGTFFSNHDDEYAKRPRLFLLCQVQFCGANSRKYTEHSGMLRWEGLIGGEKENCGEEESGFDAWKAYMRRQTDTNLIIRTTRRLAQGKKFDIWFQSHKDQKRRGILSAFLFLEESKVNYFNFSISTLKCFSTYVYDQYDYKVLDLIQSKFSGLLIDWI